jgi:hypothetical protein
MAIVPNGRGADGRPSFHQCLHRVRVNTSRLEGGGFELLLKAGSVGLSAGSSHIEVAVRCQWHLILDVFDPYLTRWPHFRCSRPTGPCPISVGSNIVCAVSRTRSAARAKSDPSDIARARDTYQQHMDVIQIDRPGMNDHFMRGCCLAQQFPTPDPNSSSKPWVTILPHPDEVVLAVPNRMAAPLIACIQPFCTVEALQSQPPEGVGLPGL